MQELLRGKGDKGSGMLISDLGSGNEALGMAVRVYSRVSSRVISSISSSMTAVGGIGSKCGFGGLDNCFTRKACCIWTRIDSSTSNSSRRRSSKSRTK